jgi:hypothetical protein
MYAPVAEAPALVGGLDDALLETYRRLIGYRRIAVAVSGKPHQSTGATL